jgi:antitoxin (DNA-binding transcriptional repressor) of toxin-antitoxin stability system
MTPRQTIRHMLERRTSRGLVRQLLRVPPGGKPVTITVDGKPVTLLVTAPSSECRKA